MEGGTPVRTEDYLQTARDMKFRIDELEKERMDIMSNMISVKSTSDYSDRVQSSPKQDSLEMQVIRITERMERLDKKIVLERQALITRRHEIREAICQMKEGQYRMFLLDYYIECKTWQQIFKEYGYISIESAYHIKKRAIMSFEKVYSKIKVVH